MPRALRARVLRISGFSREPAPRHDPNIVRLEPLRSFFQSFEDPLVLTDVLLVVGPLPVNRINEAPKRPNFELDFEGFELAERA